jgi:REP element-mobilizing transposase RayT
MANTYTQLNVQTVFAVKGRDNILTYNFRNQLFEYIAGILRNGKQFPLAINGSKDHVHIFFELNPDTSLSNVLELVKSNSSKWINSNNLVMGRFEWQRGYSGFSYSRSQRNNVIQYIMNQDKHHKMQTFREEYLEMLRKFEMEFDERYIFEFYD